MLLRRITVYPEKSLCNAGTVPLTMSENMINSVSLEIEIAVVSGTIAVGSSLVIKLPSLVIVTLLMLMVSYGPAASTPKIKSESSDTLEFRVYSCTPPPRHVYA